MYSTLALEKEREIVKEEAALRKEKEALCCYAVQGCIQSYIYIYTGMYIQELTAIHIFNPRRACAARVGFLSVR